MSSLTPFRHRRNKKTAELTQDFLESLFVLRQQDAAQMLGFSITTMKHLCRRLGIRKWPYSRGRPRELEAEGTKSVLISPRETRVIPQQPQQTVGEDCALGDQGEEEGFFQQVEQEGERYWISRTSDDMEGLFREALDHVQGKSKGDRRS
ncbi:hypothetical protein GUITHDRAFT_99884 [Guillardia theta CCMP2712]|uniref:RWP-RK domain-containing protein n=1 Tax=Guillardia theta (strain CCMP2712) TaxID=905079 RepID=L1K1G8_GUITC|nr:hypothetical protein GUITHDRAFT_99884 [Guillardia theta CCMP2712]EKX54404.1 hypothetical protein GUITHDRAFT_99884 [Guillardia theta CCMP2712]|eukprot:XP_005841384.1 hypothetical protein GUITHDRAFT_99884 [Guillardia theta CCMP2712]